MKKADSLEEQVLAFCRREELLPEGGTVLAAVSGGADSMCLLTLLNRLAPRLGFSLAAAHYHHGLRGAEADRDEAFVRNWCAAENIPCCCGRGDVAGRAEALGTGIEETARAMRYEFLEKTAEQLGADRIATAHNAEDQAETLLLHLVRGSGLQGLGGMAPRRGKLIRPLLEISRGEIEAYNKENAIPHVEDETNTDLNYSRNYLRHQVLPLLKELNPQVVPAMGRAAECLRRENDALRRLTEEALLPDIRKDGAEVSVPARALNRLPEGLRPRGVQLLAEQLDSTVILSAAHRRAVAALAAGENPSGQVNLPEGLLAQRRYELLILSRQGGEPEREPESWLPLPGELEWRGQVITARAAVYQGENQEKDSFWLKLKGSRLRVRPRRAGDELTPVGRRRKSLKRWMIEEKIPRPLRDSIPVLEQDGVICGVPGLGADRSAHPGPGETAWHILVKRKGRSE